MSIKNKVLFIINPVSGVKDNHSIAQLISNTLDNHNIKFDIMYTKHHGHAKDYVHTMDSVLYDSITTFVYPISAGFSWKETIAYAISGLLFTIVHIVSNIAIFGIVVPQYLKKLDQ